MQQVGMREFRTHLCAIVRRVRENGESFEITRYGKPIAILRRIHPWEKEARGSESRSNQQGWDDWKRLKDEPAGRPMSGDSAVDEVPGNSLTIKQ